MPIILFVLFLIYGVAQIIAGYLGIADGFGTIWAIVGLIIAFFFRFTLPITIGSFFGAMTVWGWHWFFALLFAAPGLIFIVPGILTSIMSRKNINL